MSARSLNSYLLGPFREKRIFPLSHNGESAVDFRIEVPVKETRSPHAAASGMLMQRHPAWMAQQLVFDPRLLMVKELVEFDVDGIAQMATISLASRQQRFGFVGASRIYTHHSSVRVNGEQVFDANRQSVGQISAQQPEQLD